MFECQQQILDSLVRTLQFSRSSYTGIGILLLHVAQNLDAETDWLIEFLCSLLHFLLCLVVPLLPVHFHVLLLQLDKLQRKHFLIGWQRRVDEGVRAVLFCKGHFWSILLAVFGLLHDELGLEVASGSTWVWSMIAVEGLDFLGNISDTIVLETIWIFILFFHLNCY